MMIRRYAALAALLALSACGETAQLRPEDGMGPAPKLPPPHQTLFPTVKTSKAIGWPIDRAPTPAPGFAVRAFARNLEHPRWLYVLPNGDVLVAETDAPPNPDDAKGIKGFFMKLIMKSSFLIEKMGKLAIPPAMMKKIQAMRGDRAAV